MAHRTNKAIRAKGAVHYLSRGLRGRIRRMLGVLYSDGWRNADFMARQVVDDLNRAGSRMTFRQHLVEQMAHELLMARCADNEDIQTAGKRVNRRVK